MLAAHADERGKSARVSRRNRPNPPASSGAQPASPDTHPNAGRACMRSDYPSAGQSIARRAIDTSRSALPGTGIPSRVGSGPDSEARSAGSLVP